MSDTSHVKKAFETVWAHQPEWEQGFLQHTLLVALKTPGVAMNMLLPEALPLLPAYLRNEPLSDTLTEDVKNLLAQLHAIADLDPRFLKNFMDGKPLRSVSLGFRCRSRDDLPKRPRRRSTTHLAVPIGKRMVEIRSEGAQLSASEWKDLARFCFVSAAAIGEPYQITVENMKILCGSPEDLLEVFEHLAKNIPNAKELLVNAFKSIPESEQTFVARKISESTFPEGDPKMRVSHGATPQA